MAFVNTFSVVPFESAYSSSYYILSKDMAVNLVQLTIIMLIE